MACATEDQTCSHSFGKPTGLSIVSKLLRERILRKTHLSTDLLLILLREAHEMIILGTDKEGYRGFVESSSLPIPLFDAVQCALSCQVKHEQYGNCIIAH